MAKASLVSALLVTLALGCSSLPPSDEAPPPTAAERTPEKKTQLPPSLEALDLKPAQRREILALRADLERDVQPLIDAGREFGRAFAVAARQCKGDSPFIASEAEATVRTGEQVRDKVLDGINRFHRILTPAQRQAIVDRLLASEEKSRETPSDQSRTRSFGSELDLSFSQMFTLLVRARALQVSLQEKIEPWRPGYRNAVAAFAKPDFDVRDHPVAQAPVFEVATDFVREAFRMLMPVLKPKQCEILGDFIAEKMDESEKKQRD